MYVQENGFKFEPGPICEEYKVAICFYDLESSRHTLKGWTFGCSVFFVPVYREVLRETKNFKNACHFLGLVDTFAE